MQIDPATGLRSFLLPLCTAPDLAYLAGSMQAVQAVLAWLREAEKSHMAPPGNDLRPEVQVQDYLQFRLSMALQL
jgi:hypothetical protein